MVLDILTRFVIYVIYIKIEILLLPVTQSYCCQTKEGIVSESPPKITCGECGDVIVGVIPKWKNSKPICRNCAFRFNSKDRASPPENQEKKNKQDRSSQEKNPRKVWLGTVLVLSMVVFIATLPRLTSSFAGEKPARIGSAKTDSRCDRCIGNLWRISKILQDTGSPDNPFTCPESGKPYVINNTVTDTVVECPSPELHNVKSVRISRNTPFPEVIQ
jgi:hypothetical protein